MTLKGDRTGNNARLKISDGVRSAMTVDQIYDLMDNLMPSLTFDHFRRNPPVHDKAERTVFTLLVNGRTLQAIPVMENRMPTIYVQWEDE
jgi:hypothetical protein